MMENQYSSMDQLIADAQRYVSDHMSKDADETFAQMLLRLISERGLSDTDFCKKADLSKQSFSDLIHEKHAPNMNLAASCALALELSPEQAETLLNKADHTLNQKDKFSLIVKFCLEKGVYDIQTLNLLITELE